MSKTDVSRSLVSWRRLKALCYKETLQIFRDPSSILIAFVLPVVLLFIFGYGINLDSGAIRVGLLLQDDSLAAHRFAASFYGSRYFTVVPGKSREQLQDDLTNARIRGFVVVAQNFDRILQRPSQAAPVQVVTDGSEPEIAAFLEIYSQGAWSGWLQERRRDMGLPPTPQIEVAPQFWFNPSAESRYYLIPGSITLIMTVVGSWRANGNAGQAPLPFRPDGPVLPPGTHRTARETRTGAPPVPRIGAESATTVRRGADHGETPCQSMPLAAGQGIVDETPPSRGSPLANAQGQMN
jgi:hypothetical protein